MDTVTDIPAYKTSLAILETIFRNCLGKIDAEAAYKLLDEAASARPITDEALAFALDLIADEFARNSFAGFMRTDGLAARFQTEQLRADKR